LPRSVDRNHQRRGKPLSGAETRKNPRFKMYIAVKTRGYMAVRWREKKRRTHKKLRRKAGGFLADGEQKKKKV